VSTSSTSEVEIEDLVAEAYVWGLPLIMSYKTMYHYALDESGPEFKAPLNHLGHTTRVNGPGDVALVSPNTDSLFSLLWMDLRAEPIVVSVPEVDGDRYYSIQLQDLSTHNFGYIGTRTTGNGAGHFLVAGPNWRGVVPDDVSGVFRSDAHIARAVLRPQLIDAADLPLVRSIQSGFGARGLADFLGRRRPTAAVVDYPAWDEGSAAGAGFLDYLAWLMQFVEPDSRERALWDRLAAIGVEPGRACDWSGRREAVARGVASAVAVIEERSRTVAIAGDSRAGYDGDWLRRAAVARVGWGANSAEEACYPVYREDAEGRALDAREHRYTLRFEPGGLPPVRAFWSVTMYDAEMMLLVDNPIDRYVINSAMLEGLTSGDDGSLTLYLQRDPPGSGHESNWLPAPDGGFYLILRLYWPSDSILDGTWEGPEVRRIA